MAAQSPPFALQNGSHSAALFRQAAYSPWLAGGTMSPADYAVTAQGTPNMSVQVAAGRAWIPGSQVANVSGGNFSTQAGYFGLNDAPATVTISTANATNPRIDVVYVAVQDSFYSGTNNVTVLGVVTGTPAASPTVPAAPSNAVVLAQVAVAANATSITNSNIAQTPAASMLAIARGGIDPALSSSRPSTGLYPGYSIYETDTGREQVSTGTAWTYVGGSPPPTVLASLGGGFTAVSGHIPVVSKDASGMIAVSGWIANTSTFSPTANVCLTLPAGYTPASKKVFLVPYIGSAVGYVIVTVATTGAITIDQPGTTSIAATSNFFLDNIRFHPTDPGTGALA